MNTVTPIREEAAAALFSTEAEQQLLGMLMLNSDLSGMVESNGGAALFYDPVHAAIYETIAEKTRAGLTADAPMVGMAMSDHSGLQELGGGRYLVRLAGVAISTHAGKSYAKALAEMARKREIQGALSQATAALARSDMTASEIAAHLEGALMAMNTIGDEDGPVSMLSAVVDAMKQVQAAYQGDFAHAVKSGIPSVDDIIPGFFPGELTILGGRPAMGKSAVALSIALNAARAGHGVAIASLEMTPAAMAMRALSEDSANSGRAVHYTNMRRGQMEEDQMRHLWQRTHEVGNLPIHFLSRKFADIGSMTANVRRIAKGGNLKLLIVDYAQLMTAPGKSRYEQITAISLALKGMAVSLDIPVIALSQLSRQIESREDKRPVMSDLRESGQLEQDADNIMFCYRPEYYLAQREPEGHDFDASAKWQAEMADAKGKMEIIVAKQRMGETGTAKCFCALATNSVWG